LITEGVEGAAVLSYPPGTFIPLAIATHGLVGLALGAVLFDRPTAGLAAGLAPDADFLLPELLGWPLVHRGITHAAVALLAVAAVAAALGDRRTLGALTVAYGSHLLIDITTSKGIPLAYPLLDERLSLDIAVGGHAPETTLALWVVCLAVVGSRRNGG
jgi:inner membrane protein